MGVRVCLWFSLAVVSLAGCAQGEAAVAGKGPVAEAGGGGDQSDAAEPDAECASPCDCTTGKTCTSGVCEDSPTALCCTDRACSKGDSCTAQGGTDSICGATPATDSGVTPPADSGGADDDSGGGGTDSGGSGGACAAVACKQTLDCFAKLCLGVCDTASGFCK